MINKVYKETEDIVTVRITKGVGWSVNYVGEVFETHKKMQDGKIMYVIIHPELIHPDATDRTMVMCWLYATDCVELKSKSRGIRSLRSL